MTGIQGRFACSLCSVEASRSWPGRGAGPSAVHVCLIPHLARWTSVTIVHFGHLLVLLWLRGRAWLWAACAPEIIPELHQEAVHVLPGWPLISVGGGFLAFAHVRLSSRF